MKILCIYHGGCDDGFGAAYAVWKKYGENQVEFYPATHGDPPPDVKGRDVIMVDFSYKSGVLQNMIGDCKTMLILDHHKTAESDLQGLHNPEKGIQVFFDMERSGATMAWDYFHSKNTRPSLISYVEDRDLWRKALPYSNEVTIALRSHLQAFDLWDTLKVTDLATEGTAIQRYYRTLVDDAKKDAQLFNFDGHMVPVVNASHFMSSEVAGELSDGHPFAATYSIKHDGMIVYSLRSRDNGIDVSEIAKSYGGGGHFHAAGFQVSKLVHTNDIA